MTDEYEQFKSIYSVQLTQSGIPQHLWQTLHKKLSKEVYDAGNYFVINRLRYIDPDDEDNVTYGSEVCASEPLSVDGHDNVFLIDHAWSFQLTEMREGLKANTDLLKRVANFMDLVTPEASGEESNHEQEMDDLLKRVMRVIWKFSDNYTIAQKQNGESEIGIQDKVTVWYLLDEFGARIQHSETPTCKIVPFFYAPRQIFYSVMWLLKDLDEGDELTRDRIPQIPHNEERQFHTLPWIDADLTDVDLPPRNYLNKAQFESHRMKEYLPDKGDSSVQTQCEGGTDQESQKTLFTVFSDVDFVSKNLTHPRFKLVNTPEEADIWWLYEHFKDFRGLSCDRPHSFINQFPNEAVLTVKDLLAALSHDTAWYPLTFNLLYEVPHFVQEFQRRQQLQSADEEGESDDQNKNNIWIVKPWNLGRGLGIVISDHVDQILCLARGGPMIASQYVCRPLLFYRDDIGGKVKFDVRYMILLHSLRPLTLGVHKVFWLRFANKEFSLNDFDDYEKHFTVMNYAAPERLKQLHCHEFVAEFEVQYQDQSWSTVEARIHKTLREIVETVSAHDVPFGLFPNPQSRAMYAVDLLLEWRQSPTGLKEIHPVVCEVNYCPDCTRACRYHPDFFNDVFEYLFLGSNDNVIPL